MAAAMRSMAECAASDNMPSEPVSRPVASLSSVMPAAADTERTAAVRLRAAGSDSGVERGGTSAAGG